MDMAMLLLNSGNQGKLAAAHESAKGSCGQSERKTLREEIDRLFVTSRKGLWGLLIFLAASIIAFYFRDHGITNSLPHDFREMLGPAPPVFLVSILLGISTFSSLVLIGGRIFHGWEPGSTLMHLLFRLLFYLLYFVVDSLADYYHAVFISGIVVLSLQHYNIWSYASKAIDMKLTLGGGLSVWQKRVSGK
jgi:hypothetical protein